MAASAASDAATLASSDEELPPAGAGHSGGQRDYSDARLDRVAAYTTTTMRLKPDKWAKMMLHDELRVSWPQLHTLHTAH